MTGGSSACWGARGDVAADAELGRHDHTPGGWEVGQGQADIQIMLRVRP
jgi:hypothetical protein